MIKCLYTRTYFEHIYKTMLDLELNTYIDASETMWHLQDVEDILINEHGYRRTSTGGVM